MFIYVGSIICIYVDLNKLYYNIFIYILYNIFNTMKKILNEKLIQINIEGEKRPLPKLKQCAQ